MLARNLFRALVALSILAGLGAADAHAQKYLRKANKQYELGDFAATIDGFEKYLRKRPDANDTRAKLARAYRMTGRLADASAAYEVLAKAAPQNPDYAYGHAVSLMEEGKYDLAVEALSRAASLGHPQASSMATRLQYAQQNDDAESAYRVSNEFANTRGDDYGATLLGEAVVLVSERDGGEAKLMRATRDGNDFLRVPTRLHKVLGDAINEGPVAYSPSGELVAYTRNNFQSGERFTPEAGWELSLMLSTVGDEGDFQPGKPFVHNGPGFSTGFPAFSPDGQRLYYASDRPGGQGGYDLYYSERTGSGWSSPINLGDKVNTPGNEIAPTIVGRSLYFSSDYLPGYGGMDVYRADLIGDAVTTVVNLGRGINGPLDDVGFAQTPDGKFGYFSSNRPGGKGGLDVYRALRNGKSLTLAVVDGATGAPIRNALLDFSDCGQGNFLTGVDGEYTFSAVEAMSCRPTVRKSGYNVKEFSLNAAGLRENQRLEIKLNPEDKITIYEGKVIHSRTGDALAGVRVSAEQIDGPFRSEATTGADGRYELKLERGAEYVIAYQARGMNDIDREVSSYDRDGSGILSTFAMFPVAVPSENTGGSGREMTTGTTVADGITYSEPSGANARVVTRKPSGAGSNAVRRTPGAVDPGFAVQVAAVNQNTTDISEYQTKLRELGQVYGKREAGVLRVRVGPFASKGEAARVQARARALGFSDAYVAREDGGAAIGIDRVERVREVAPEPTPAPQPAATTSRGMNEATPRPNAQSAQRAGVSAGSYLIRLATYGNFTNFDASKAAGIGTLTTRKRGEYTVVLLQGYATAGEAEAKLADARAAGFTDAHVVIEDAEGTLRKVR